jgi:uncharacterized protein with GYD domain
MPKFMVQATYTVDGMKGLLKEGGSKRRAVVEKAIAGLGGKIEGFYFAFGPTDVVIIVDLPDVVSGAALGLTIGASGAVKATTTPLISAEDVDAAAKKHVAYSPPGA